MIGKGFKLPWGLIVWLAVLSVFVAACSALSSNPIGNSGSVSGRESISVTGFGEAVGKPDVATVQLGVEVEGASIGEAIDRSTQIVETVQQALLAEGIAETDMQTSNFSVWREEGFDRATGQPTGEIIYHVDSTLMVKVRDIGRVSQIIQTGLDNGATNVFGLTFGIDDTAVLEAEARTKALEDANMRAEQLAALLGVGLGDPVVVSELAGGGISPFALEAAFARPQGGGGGGPPLSPGELTVRVQLDVVYGFDR